MRACQSRPFHSLCLRSVLIAVAIQGVTPDAQDLASLNSLRVFCPVLSGSGMPCRDDGLPDEVCEAMTIEIDRELLANAGLNALVTLNHVKSENLATTIPSNALLLRRVGRHSTAAHDVPHCLCLLKC
jgi:hypothetical protein